MNTDLQHYFEILCNDSTNPCSIVDVQNNQLVFMNTSMIKMLKETSKLNFSNEDLYDSFKHLHTKNEKIREQLQLYKFIEDYTYDDVLNRHFRVHNTLIQFNDKQYNLCKYFATSSYTKQMITFEDAMTKSVEILNEHYSFEQMTRAFLELLGNFYKSSKSYVFYLDPDKTDVASQYGWVSNEKDTILNDIATKLPLSDMIYLIENFADNGIIEINREGYQMIESEISKNMLDTAGVDNIVICSIEDEVGQCIGAVGLSNKAEDSFDYRLLKTITRFIQDGFSKTDMREELISLGDIDFLTGFYSRSKYVKVFKYLETNAPDELGVIVVNIHGLRAINEYLGFVKGDEQIIQTATILKSFFFEPFYRISGDEFISFCTLMTEEEFSESMKLIYEDIKQREDCQFSIGYAYKKGNVNVSKLLSEADNVMYINKQEYYQNPNYLEETDGEILTELFLKMANEELFITLHPRVDLNSGKTVGAEALIRCIDNQTQELLMPEQFLPLYVEKNIVRHIDIFVMNKVCEVLLSWKEHGKSMPISINISPVTLLEEGIVDTIASICDDYQIERELVVLEMKESDELIDTDILLLLVEDLKMRGFKISLDDFGGKKSNISTLASTTFEEVKIDQALIEGLTTNNKNVIIAKSIVDICKNFEKTKIIAEAIESQEQLDILKGLGCDYGQGNLFSIPLSSDEFFEKYIK